MEKVMRSKNQFASLIKIHISAALTAVMVISSSAVAQSIQDHTVNISGISPDLCIIPTGAQHDAELDILTDAEGKIRLVTSNIVIGELSCNYGITMALQTKNGALTRLPPAGPIPVNFTDKVKYTATVDWSGSTFKLEATEGALKKSSETLGPKNDILMITIKTHAEDKNLVSGSYSDVLTLRIGGLI
jgi:hypothetical protein